MGSIGLCQFVEEVGWGGNTMGDDDGEGAPTAWETTLAELAAYGDGDGYDDDDGGVRRALEASLVI